jgi:hypothetical protein
MGFGTLGQGALDLGELVRVELRQPPGATRPAQPISTRPTPGGAPIRDDLVAHAHVAGNLGRRDALLEQVRGPHAALLQRLEIAPRADASATCLAEMLLVGSS